MSVERLNAQLAVLLGEELADWERQELAERLARLRPAVRREVLRQLPVVWPVSYALYHTLVEQADKAGDCLRPSQFPAWVKAALDVYEAQGLRAAQVFLAEVEENFLCQLRGQAGVRLAEVEPRLLPYACGLLGREVRLAASGEASFDISVISLPADCELLPEPELNFLFYKFTVTFLLSLERLGTFRAQEQGGCEARPLAAFLAAFPEPLLAADLFYLAEAVRILAHFRRDFPGLMADFARLAPALAVGLEALAAACDQAGFVRALRRSLLRGEDEAEASLPEAMVRLLDRHRQPGCTADQSLTLTRRLYEHAARLPGPYRREPALPFMGRLAVAEAYQGLERRREELEEKLAQALGRTPVTPSPSPASREQEPGENGEPRERPALSNEAGNLLDLRPGAEIRPEELEMRLAAGVLRVGGMEFELTEELKGLLREMTAAEGRLSGQAVVSAAGRAGQGLEQGVSPAEEPDSSRADGPLAYDEWDYRRLGFRKRWCQVRLKEIAPVAGNFVAHTLSKYRGVLTTLRRQFEMMSIQETFVRRQREGSDIDLDAAVEAVADLKAGRAPSERLFVRLQRNDRQIAALFLLDMSSSTEGWVSLALRESLILMCESLRVLGDRYAIYGFSGMRRLRSEIFRIKEFDEPYSEVIKGRIAAITPQEYTRMGPAIRHATTILAGVEARVRLLITLSDGKPEDYDGYKGAYAVEDTRHALIEAKTAGVHPFCITVDREAHGYIAHMYGEINYIFIDQVAKLPLRMPEIYRHLTS